MSKPDELKRWDIVEVEWLDSVHEGGWRKIKDIDSEPDPDQWLKHKSIGYVLEVTKQAVGIVQSRQSQPDDKASVDSHMCIPKVAITNITIFNSSNKE